MAEVWPEVQALVEGRPLVVRDASFDITVLHSSLAVAGATTPDLMFVCTLALAQRAWQGRLSWRLDDLAAGCKLASFQYDEAGADAAMAAWQKQMIDKPRRSSVRSSPSLWRWA